MRIFFLIIHLYAYINRADVANISDGRCLVQSTQFSCVHFLWSEQIYIVILNTHQDWCKFSTSGKIALQLLKYAMESLMNPFYNNALGERIVCLYPVSEEICASAFFTLGKILLCVNRLLQKTGACLPVVLEG